jgi:hypothetical protein
MSFAYRCNKCRGRNTIARRIDDYIRIPKCRHCGHKGFYLDKDRQYRGDYCSCEGYHYTHRKKSKFCIHHPDYQLNVRTERYGEDRLDVQLEIALAAPVPDDQPDEAPF